MTGPDLPSPDQPITVDVFECRWPTGAEKVELLYGDIFFYGEFDERDAEIARRAYPGRAIEFYPGPGQSGAMIVKPGPRIH